LVSWGVVFVANQNGKVILNDTQPGLQQQAIDLQLLHIDLIQGFLMVPKMQEIRTATLNIGAL
jgi:hypothetical protein